jgi:hypothetical protein
MKNFIFTIIVFITINNFFSQTNLVCNGSFEEVNPNTFLKMPTNDYIFTSHFIEQGYKNGNSYENLEPLFKHWTQYNGPDGSIINTTFPSKGIEFGIMPGLFVTGFENYYNEPIVFQNSDGNVSLLSEFHGKIKLDGNTPETYMLDLSPPTLKFSNSMWASHGDNCVALIDFRVDHHDGAKGSVSGISSKLKEPLRKKIRYIVSLDASKMALSNFLQDSGWDGFENDYTVDVVFMMDDEGNLPRLIFPIPINSDGWNHLEYEFIPDFEYTKIGIRFNPIGNPPFVNSNKIIGCFIDNIKVYEACDNPLIMCNNANYRKDLLDVILKIEETAHLKTIKIKNLENVKHFRLHIFDDDNVLIRSEDVSYPQSGDFHWNGKNDQGNMSPDGNYRAQIYFVKNDCYTLIQPDSKHFKFENKYTSAAFDEVNIFVGERFGIYISNLDEVLEMKIEIFSLSTGGLVYTKNVTNPQHTIAIATNESILNPTEDVDLATADYKIRLTLSNNCYYNIEIEKTLYIDYPGNTELTSEFLEYYWNEVEKDIECSFFTPNHNYLPPKNCCEGNLYISDVKIYNSFEVNILKDIVIGPNVVFPVSNVYNILNAGEQIIVDPSSSSIYLNSSVTLNPGVYNCLVCLVKNEEDLIMNYVEEDDKYLDTQNEIISQEEEEKDSIRVNKEFIVFPNPVLSNRTVSISSLNKIINVENFKVSILNSNGIPINYSIHNISNDKISVKLDENVVKGLYFFDFRTDNNFARFKFEVLK